MFKSEKYSVFNKLQDPFPLKLVLKGLTGLTTVKSTVPPMHLKFLKCHFYCTI